MPFRRLFVNAVCAWPLTFVVFGVGAQLQRVPNTSLVMPDSVPAFGYTNTDGAIVPAGTEPSTIRIDDRDASIVYSVGNNLDGGSIRDWYLYGGHEDYGGTESSSKFERGSGPAFQGSSVAVSFIGTGITWIGKMGPNYGKSSYSIDGGMPRTFDAYNPVETDQHPNVIMTGLRAGSHVLQVAITDQKNSRSSNYYQTIDAFQIAGSALPLTDGLVAGYNSSQLSRSGSWSCGTDHSDISGGHCWSNRAKSAISWQFTGSLIEIYGRPDLENGYFQVYIDGKAVATVDGHFGNLDDDSLNSVMLFARKLSSSGPHTIKIVVSGTHDPAATNSYVQLDEFVAFP